MTADQERCVEQTVGLALRGETAAFDRIEEPLRSIARQRYHERLSDTPQAREVARVARDRAALGLDG